MVQNNKALAKSLDWVLDIDPPAIITSVKSERESSPYASNKALVDKVFSSAKWKATSTGFVTGLPANPWASVPISAVDVAATLRSEVSAVARAAVIYDEKFFDDLDAKWELLLPVFGLSLGSQFLREVGVRGGMEVTRVLIKQYLSKETLKQFKIIILKYFGIKVTEKAVITKTLPIVGGLIGSTWNYIEVNQVQKRTIDYFNARDA